MLCQSCCRIVYAGPFSLLPIRKTYVRIFLALTSPQLRYERNIPPYISLQVWICGVVDLHFNPYTPQRCLRRCTCSQFGRSAKWGVECKMDACMVL